MDQAGNGPTPKFQIEGEDSEGIMSVISAGDADANRCGTINLGRHRNGTVGGTPTIVQNGDALGAVVFSGGDGGDMLTCGAKIHAVVDGAPGADDMPGALLFSTTPDGQGHGFNTERMRLDSSGRLLVGTSSARTNVFAAFAPAQQIEGTTADTSRQSITRNANSAGAEPALIFGKSRGTSNGSNTVVSSGDRLGALEFSGADGTVLRPAAHIRAEVDGTPGDADMPGRLILATTADGASSPTERLRIDSSGRVGIANSSMGSLYGGGDDLVVGDGGDTHQGITIYTGTGRQGIVAFADGTSGAAQYAGYLIYDHDGDRMAFATTGQERMRIDSSGNVGIGSTDPADKLEVVGDIRLKPASGANTLVNFEYNNGVFAQIRGNGRSGSPLFGDLEFWTKGSGDSAPLERMVVDADGKVGIGTTSPGVRLHVNVDSASETDVARFQASNGADIQFLDIGVDPTSNLVSYDASGSTGGAHVFRRGGTEVMRLDNSSRLLVGTSSAPTGGDWAQYSKAIFTGSTGSAADAGTISLKRGGTAANGNPLGVLSFSDSNGGEFAYIKCEADGTTGSSDYPGRLVFSTTADGASSPTERMRIDSSGNIKAGTSCDFLPSIDAGFAGHSDLGDPSLRFEDAYVRDGVTTGSDRNYKSDIRNLSEAERAVAVSCKSLLRAWKWTEAVEAKGDAARTHIGIIAQDLEQAFTDQGLDAHSYAMFCEDTWYEVDGQRQDSGGVEYTADNEEAVAVTRLSVRYHELLAFIIAAI
jgi:hypothetical protein